MIAKIFPSRGGSGGAATISYAFGQTEHKDEHQAAECEFLTSNLLVVPDPTIVFELGEMGELEVGRIAASNADLNPIIEQFEDLASRNTRVQEPYWHAMLSLSPEDEGKVDHETLGKIANQFMSDMGFDDAAWVSTVHRDTSHTHIHFAACTVQNLPGNPVVDRYMDFSRAMDSVRQIEADYGLKEVHMPEEGAKMDGRVDRTTAHEIREIVDLCVKETSGNNHTPGPNSAEAGSNIQTFVSKLSDFGVDVQFQFKEGRPTGISYSKDDSSWSGGKLRGGGRFTLPGLEKRGITYSDNDKQFCEKVTDTSKERREHNIVLTPSRFVELNPAGGGRVSRDVGGGVNTYKHAEPNCLIKMSFCESFAPKLNSFSTPPHYAVKKGKKVEAFWRLQSPRAGFNTARNSFYLLEELERKLKKKLAKELSEQIINANSFNLVTAGLQPEQNPIYCTPRKGYVPDTTRDPEKASRGGLLFS